MGAAVIRREGEVHGMSRSHVVADWPPLTTEELVPLARLWPEIGAVRQVVWHSPRPFAASGIVATSLGAFFVKRHHISVRNVADLDQEHCFMAHLRAAGVPVAHVLPTRDGATSLAAGYYVYEMHAVADGEDLYRDAVSWSPFAELSHARAAGAALANMHRAAESYVAPSRDTGLLVANFTAFGAPDPIAALHRRIAKQPWLATALAEREWQHDIARDLMPWHKSLAPHLSALTPLWTHNDFHASNLLWNKRCVSAILDFGLANRTSAGFDLATTIERNAVEWVRLEKGETDIAHPDLARELIRAYQAVHPLPSGQAAALTHMLPLVHAEFALSELAYFHGILRAPARAELAYTTFLLGHADWFSSAHGSAFLTAVRDAAQ